MVYSLAYTRPSARLASTSSLNGQEKQKSIDESIKSASSCSMCAGIPDALSFDRIISGGTCPPCTLRDFMNYLKYIELAAENLQFFLWLRDYTKRFNELSASERDLAPEWTASQAETERMGAQSPAMRMKISPDTAAALHGTGLETGPRIANIEKPTSPFYTPCRTPSDEMRRFGTPSEFDDEKSSTWVSQSSTADVLKRAGDAYNDAGLKWQPFTIQPFRDEIARIITIYIADGGNRQLNLSSKERSALLHALAHTTHPSAFKYIATTVEWSLRCQAHPNFIRWTICNGNRPRVIFARGLGIFLILVGLIIDILITLSSLGRAYRVLALPVYILGISTLVAAWKGMCVVLHGMHHRHMRPWELFQDADDETIIVKNTSTDSIDSSNSFETEPWVAKYQKRNVIRKIFDRERWIEEPALRQIQDTIFVQSILGALLAGAVITAIFVAVPGGHFY